MAGWKTLDFIGTFPMNGPRNGADNAAVDGVNFNLEPGSLTGIPGLNAVQNVSCSSVFRIPTGSDPTDWTSSFWMQFADADTNVVRSLVVNDSFERYYWTSPSGGFKYATKAQILAVSTPLNVGVTPPNSYSLVAFAVPGTGGAGNPPVTETRSYVVSFVSIYGEESQPCNPASGTGYADAQWQLNDIPQPVVVTGQVPINVIRVYRTVSASDGSSNYYKVTDLAVGVTVFLDTASDTAVTANEIIPSTTWTPPPSNLQGLIAMPNGIMAGWVGSTVYFSEPFQPQSWPTTYELQTQDAIVGMGVYGNTLVVLTSGRPVQITGVRPNTMAMWTNNVAIPCLSRRSIVSSPDGVYYASDNGLILIGPNGIANITEQFVSREDWNNIYLPKKLMAVYVAGMYVALRSDGTGFLLRPDGLNLGLAKLNAGQIVTMIGVDIWSGRVWSVINAAGIYEYMCVTANPMPYTWTTREFTLPQPCNLGVAQVYFDPPTYTLPGGVSAVTLTVYAYQRGATGNQKVTVFSGPVDISERAVRLPASLRSDVWQMSITAYVRVHQLTIATSVNELRSV